MGLSKLIYNAFVLPVPKNFCDQVNKGTFNFGGAHDSTWIDGSSELFTFPKLCSILIANIASLALPELIYE